MVLFFFFLINGNLNTQWEKLWENPNPSSAFSSQVVSVDLSKYSLAAIEYAVSIGVMRGIIAQCFIGKPIPLPCFGFASNTLYFRFRECTVYSDKVSFTDAQVNGVKDNAYCIPIAIYGVK